MPPGADITWLSALGYKVTGRVWSNGLRPGSRWVIPTGSQQAVLVAHRSLAGIAAWREIDPGTGLVLHHGR
jgi:hypothetical protein